MRILYIDQYFSTRKGFSGTRSYEFARRMVQQGHQVTMLTSASSYSSLAGQKRFYKREKIEGIDVLSIRIGYSHMMSMFRRMLAFVLFMLASSVVGIFQKRHDVVFASSTPLSVGIPGLLVSWIRGTPFVFEVRDLWPRAPIELGVLQNRALIALLTFFEKLLYRSARQIITLSPGMKDGIVARGIAPDKVTVIPNACDLDMTSGLPDKLTLRKQLGFGDEFVAVYAGTIGLANDLGYVVEMAKSLERQGVEKIRFVIVGEGNELDRVRARAATLGKIPFDFAGPKSREETARYIAAADLGLCVFKALPVLGTNSPNKLFDYMAAGLPLAVNNPGWTKALVEEKNAGVYLPENDPEGGAKKLAALIQDSTALQKMSAQSKKLGESTFERGKLLDSVLTVLDKAASTQVFGIEFAVKSVADFFIGFLACAVLSPVFIAIGIAIKLDSPGPVFYRPKRIGQDGKEFSVFKFRTMVVGAENMGLGLNVEDGDSRITKVGNFLREWSLDELPQLINILLLNMSLIGPRPALADHVEKYNEAQAQRLWVKPGLTGLAQVSGRNWLSWEKKLEKDVQYVREYSLALDVKIFFKTFGVVLSREGLYEPDAGIDDDFNRFDD